MPTSRLTTTYEGTEELTVVEGTGGTISIRGGNGLQALSPCGVRDFRGSCSVIIQHHCGNMVPNKLNQMEASQYGQVDKYKPVVNNNLPSLTSIYSRCLTLQGSPGPHALYT
ncbi:hypothetical protein E2C01_001780 [Portunus trituberculatus]|uniref:Uncharacterized protein n=1 Tax=Portunus trituberculatus TaxID=210409 RepID=A0A5B7CI50_PORTR|nr:hypothetical protein [Portunus trituberculatus]